MNHIIQNSIISIYQIETKLYFKSKTFLSKLKSVDLCRVKKEEGKQTTADINTKSTKKRIKMNKMKPKTSNKGNTYRINTTMDLLKEEKNY